MSYDDRNDLEEDSRNDAIGYAVNQEKNRVDDILSGKADLSGATYAGELGTNSYLNFGANWRVAASNDGKRLNFENKRNGV